MGRSMKAVMDGYADAVKDIAMILLIIAGARRTQAGIVRQWCEQRDSSGFANMATASPGIGMADGGHHSGLCGIGYA